MNLRENWHYPFGTLCLVIAALMVSYMLWAMIDIPEKITSVNIVDVSVVSLPCSKDHFWGNLVVHGKLGEKSNYDLGYVCRDWLGQKWIFNRKN